MTDIACEAVVGCGRRFRSAVVTRIDWAMTGRADNAAAATKKTGCRVRIVRT